MKKVLTFIITMIITVIMGMTVNVSAAEVEVTAESINPYTYVTVLNKDQLKAYKDIERYYGDAWYKALKKCYNEDGSVCYINTAKSIDIGRAKYHSLQQIITNYNYN